ncbi:MAG: rRNA ((1518)-N(6)/adenine(1519)-N(6))-dimethyltransferase [Deltaproteobacteria bacterium]|nr:rRNA ((1518)-N(6)/adenine(1519)-N(6))-dimethyltransferase [Deltaproteobacteria bacterium]
MQNPRAILAKYQIRPLKRLGQSFLSDPNIIRKIIEVSDIRRDETVVEIGAGLGVMTALMARRAERVIALEIDRALIPVLHEELKKYDNVEILHVDALKYEFRTRGGATLKVVGNIPYNISSQILFRLLEARDHISSMVLMFQREVAERLVAGPGSKTYGILSVLVRLYTDPAIVFNVSPQCFYPRPKVESAVVRMDIPEKPLIGVDDDAFLLTVVRSAFSKRRKTLMNNLKASSRIGLRHDALLQVLDSLGIDPARRAETLAPEDFARLSNALSRRQFT